MNSETVGKIAKALSLAQSQFKPIKRESVNPFYKSKYADLAAIIEATKDALTANGLTVTQLIPPSPKAPTPPKPFKPNPTATDITLEQFKQGLRGLGYEDEQIEKAVDWAKAKAYRFDDALDRILKGKKAE